VKVRFELVKIKAQGSFSSNFAVKHKRYSMKNKLKIMILGMMMVMSFFSFSQDVSEIKLNPEKVKMFTPYLQVRHGGIQGLETWKSTNKLLYAKEMWYFSESFYVKRNAHPDGQVLDPSFIDISRFESHRKQDEEAIVDMPGFKDVLVLMPASKLIYKP
jgi:hypothetical protein